jgi:hypothetical protein
MTPSLTNEQIQKLSQDQQDTLGEVELRLFQKRQQVLDQARSYRGYIFFPATIGLICVCLVAFQLFPKQTLGFCLVGAFALIQFHAMGINARLNALLKLVEEDYKMRSVHK